MSTLHPSAFPNANTVHIAYIDMFKHRPNPFRRPSRIPWNRCLQQSGCRVAGPNISVLTYRQDTGVEDVSMNIDLSVLTYRQDTDVDDVSMNLGVLLC